MEHSTGVTGAAPIWHDVMEFALKALPVLDFQAPQGIVSLNVCATSGLLPTQYCKDVSREVFIKGTEPTTPDTIWQAYRVCKPSGKLATVYCPPDQVETKVFPLYPPEAADWVRENKVPQPPTDYDTTYGPSAVAGDVAIVTPKAYGYVHGAVPIMGNAKAGEFQLYRLEYGAGLDPSAWVQIGGDHHDQVNNAQLETWDTSKLDGLYTLQLIEVDGNGARKSASIQVQVDNKPAAVDLLNPTPNQQYTLEDSEWVNIQADARDNLSMDRVEFFVDNQSIGFSTVAPYTRKWTIKMVDSPPRAGEQPVKRVDTVTNPDGTTSQVEVTVSEVIQQGGRLIRRYNTGMTAVLDASGYYETHVIYVKAYDAAGNVTESPHITIQVFHKKKS